MQSGSGRTYNRNPFRVPDRMLLVTGVTRFERAKELEDWGMEVIADAFLDFCLNKVDSALHKKHISIDQPSGCYWQPFWASLGTAHAFAKERKELGKAPASDRHYADLGKRFQHPYG